MSRRHFRLDALCDIRSGGTPPRTSGAHYGGLIPWAKIEDLNVESGTVSSTKECITEAGLQSIRGRLFEPRTLLFAMYGSVGKMAWAGVRLATNQAILGISVLDSQKLAPSYLKHWLASKQADFDRDANGVTQKNLSAGYIRGLEIELPSIEEQLRIAAILDKADGLHRTRQEAVRLADDFVHSLFFTTFGDVDANTHGWDVVRLEDLAFQITDGEHQTPRRSDDGIKLLSARNVQNGFLALADVDYVPADEFERIRRRCEPQRGDVLISCSGTIGRVASVSTDEPMALVRSVALVRPDTRHVLTSFLEHYLRSASMQRRMVAASKSSAQANLFQGPIRALPVLLPPMSLQVEFERRLLSLKSWSRKAADSAEMILDLGRSLHGKYFGSGATL